MHLNFRNVNSAFTGLVQLFHMGWCGDDRGIRHPGPKVVRCDSRNGPVRMIEEPVLITYTNPKERVLFNAARDANPFFQLYESLYTLTGRNDVEPLAYYCSRIRDYSDDRETLNGTYGYRWRNALDSGWTGVEDRANPPYPILDNEAKFVDQIEMIINHLRHNPTSRRAVLQMWNVEDDLLKIHKSIRSEESKDVCCNLSVMFSLHPIPHHWSVEEQKQYYDGYRLGITVTNRSNDMIWGMLGTNYVTFSILQEYIAAHLGVEVGKYNQFTNNLHVYENNWKPEEWLEDDEKDTLYSSNICSVPLVQNPTTFDQEVKLFVERHAQDAFAGEFTEPFLATVAQPACIAFHYYRREELRKALQVVEKIKADDWRMVCVQWLHRRLERRVNSGASQ